MRRFTTCLAAASLLLLAAIPVAAKKPEPPPPPPTLTGETLFGIGTYSFEGECGPNETLTITFDVEGTALTGSYTGPFTKQGSFDVVFDVDAIGAIDSTTYEAQFEIDSPIGLVIGEEQGDDPSVPTSGIVTCEEDPVLFVEKFVLASYTAVIETPDGNRYADSGDVETLVQTSQTIGLPQSFYMWEFFESDQEATTCIGKGKSQGHGQGQGKAKCR